MSKPLVIVESPAKAKTIARYLGDSYVIASSIGHVRDLPRNASEIPAAYDGKEWAKLGVDVDNGFQPLYIVTSDKKEQVKHLKALLKDANELYLATDEDREGEAIAWHLLEVLKPKIRARRMVFHEITNEAILRALENPRELDRRLVDAQEARRVLDRLYGYEVSPVLWKKIQRSLSAGRVQSVATRIVVERERERMSFVAASYWDVTGSFCKRGSEGTFQALLTSIDGVRLASGRDFDAQGLLKRDSLVVLDEAKASSLVDGLRDAAFDVRSVERKPFKRRPAPPFMTSTLQQEAGRKLRLTAKQTMSTAQALYEAGYITYMRTDSTNLATTAVATARAQIEERYGRDFLPDKARAYSRKVANAQEAHEAIRPAGDRFRTPDEVGREVNALQASLYDLIWKRTIACQMTDAIGETVTVRLGGRAVDGRDAEFAVNGTVITHDGFRRAYVEGDDDESTGDDGSARLPAVVEGDVLDLLGLEPAGHHTQPPARYTEASLVKRLEELGVGRPSTYASIMGTIQDRGYVWKKGTALIPSFTAFSVVSLLEQHFADLVDYEFTARMEADLDAIAEGRQESKPWLSRLYFGGKAGGSSAALSNDGAAEIGLKAMVSDRLGDIDARAVNSIQLGKDSNDVPVVVRVGRYGPFLVRGEDSVGIPPETAPDTLTVERALEMLAAPSEDRKLGVDPESGLEVLARAGRFGPFIQLGVAEGKKKPKTASLFKDMQLASVTLEDALRLLTLPRTVGKDPADGIEITAQNGRYGPYITKGTDSRSLEDEWQLLSVTLDECLKLLAEPKRRRGQKASGPLRELGADTVSEKPMVIKDGRFGPYVTDGETNASLRTGDEVETLTDERASELLQLSRDRGPRKKVARRTAKKKVAKKKVTKKNVTKRKVTKKVVRESEG